jgi:metal-responsive CopG/Arc/MetJ family transcriptional regulator
MERKSPAISITLPKDLLNRVDDFRFDNRFNNRSEAIRHLVEKGLKEYKRKSSKK